MLMVSVSCNRAWPFDLILLFLVSHKNHCYNYTWLILACLCFKMTTVYMWCLSTCRPKKCHANCALMTFSSIRTTSIQKSRYCMYHQNIHKLKFENKSLLVSGRIFALHWKPMLFKYYLWTIIFYINILN